MEEKNSEKKERKMRDSGIPWIGEVPEGWGIHPLYSYFAERKNKNSMLQEQNLLSLSYGKIIRKDINTNGGLLPANFTTYNIVQPNDIVIRPTDLQNDKKSLRTGLVTEKGIITSAYISLQPIANIYIKYFHYLLHSYDINKVFYNMGNGVRQGLNYSEFSKLMLLCPGKEEQHRIADFLDSKCSEIDTLIENLRARVESAKEYKKAVITEAVTKGLDKNIDLKETDSFFWHNIPKHWDFADIKYVFEIVKRIAGKEGYDVLSVTQKGLKVKDITCNEGQIAANYKGYQFVYPDDFVMNHMDLLTGWVDCSKMFGVTSPDYRVFRLQDKNKHDLRYYTYIMQCCYTNRYFYSLGQGVSTLGRWRLQTSSFMNFQIPVPPKEEQRRIADYLDSKCSEIDALLQNYEDQITTLEEYKKSLIYQA